MPTQSSSRKDLAANLVLAGEFDAKGAVAEVGLGARQVQRRSRYSRERKEEGTRKAQRRGTSHRGDGEEEARETRFSLRFPQGQVAPRTPAGRSSTQMTLVLRHFFGTLDVTYC